MTIEIVERATGEVVELIPTKSERESTRTYAALLEQINNEDFYLREV
jgi:hypothetical protein